MKKTLVVGVFMAAVLYAAGQTAPAAENPAEKLSAVLGRWEVEGTPTGRYAKQGKTRTLRECRWAPQGHDYLICSLVVTSATMGDRRQLTIYSYNPKEHNYVAVAIVNPGMQSLPPVTLNIQGNMWTTVTENTFAGKSTQIRSTTEWLAPDRATMKIESSDDGGAHWTLMATGTEKKIAD